MGNFFILNSTFRFVSITDSNENKNPKRKMKKATILNTALTLKLLHHIKRQPTLLI